MDFCSQAQPLLRRARRTFHHHMPNRHPTDQLLLRPLGSGLPSLCFQLETVVQLTRSLLLCTLTVIEAVQNEDRGVVQALPCGVAMEG
jgi:hypothetical protein